ncbi:unnamed protein product [Cylindrotheca closterium]|uniref:Uncharacterized protein n=1 Tax=Cylindrotheca closterium TaxID=2856 RepID=A0AAD2GC27_9STRA|nr:unnamed protein product [Cylindrotheca closterium]
MVAELGQHDHAIGTNSKGVTSMKFFDKKRDLETFQDGDQIAGVDETEQGYLEEAFDQDYEPEDEDERDFNLHGQFDGIDDSKREELLADADNDVDSKEMMTMNQMRTIWVMRKKKLLWPIWITIKKMSIEEPMILGALLLIWRIYKNHPKKRLYLSLKCLK